MTLIEQYFEISNKYTEIHGDNTVVLMEVGSFFEVYQVGSLGKAEEMSILLNMILTKKNKNINEVDFKNPLMTGFPSVSFEKNISRICSANLYSIVIVRQFGVHPNITRRVDEVISPGIQRKANSSNNNFLLNVYIENFGENFVGMGFSLVDITTGENFLMDSISTVDIPDTPFTQLSSIICKYGPSEVICKVNDFNDDEIVNLSNKIDLIYPNHKLSKSQSDYNINVINNLFGTVYSVKSLLSPIEYLGLSGHQLACNSLSDSIRTIRAHNPILLNNMPLPVFIDDKNNLSITKDTLIHLNIIEDKIGSAKNGSLLDILNSTITAGGSRLLKSRLTSPSSNPKIINEWHSELELFIKDNNFKFIRNCIPGVLDLERLGRKLATGSVEPYDILSIYNSIKCINNINDSCDCGFISGFDEYLSYSNECISIIESYFLIDALDHVKISGLSSNIFSDHNPQILGMIEESSIIKARVEEIVGNFNLLYKTEGVADYSDKNGVGIKLTPSKFKLILNLDAELYSVSKTKSKVILRTSELTSLSDSSDVISLKINSLISDLFFSKTEKLLSLIGGKLSLISKFISHLDVVSNNAFQVSKLNLIKPTIINDGESSSVECKNLRHPIVESLTSSKYIKNDICFDTGKFGKIIFGVNSTGKSTLLKALGINVIMSQCGMYASSNIILSPYKKLFSRIGGGDDLFSNKSTFTIEMLDLKSILLGADEKSLVLADELSHGTETNSGVALLTSTINHLSSVKSTFLFTTHLHQITDVRSIIDNCAIDLHHLAVSNNKNGGISFDRKLLDGSGSSIYGITVAAGLGLPKPFLAEAYKTLEEVISSIDDIGLSIIANKNKYNKDKINESCQICGLSACDTHHINERKDFLDGRNNDNDFLNSSFNLINVCSSCHSMIHRGYIYDISYKQTTLGVELQFKEL